MFRGHHVSLLLLLLLFLLLLLSFYFSCFSPSTSPLLLLLVLLSGSRKSLLRVLRRCFYIAKDGTGSFPVLQELGTFSCGRERSHATPVWDLQGEADAWLADGSLTAGRRLPHGIPMARKVTR